MRNDIHRYLLLGVGATLVAIGAAYCLDPNLLLARYEIAVGDASSDNMYRGAYGGLFLTLGAAMACGFFVESFRNNATWLAILFMGGFALGRLASIAAVGMPQEQILGLLIFEISAVVVFTGLLFAPSRGLEAGS
ncbi:MAG: DUF4345 domain-containing protein [Pseudomonadota bacterium]